MQNKIKYLMLLAGIMLLITVSGCSQVSHKEIDQNQKVPVHKTENLPTNSKILIAYFTHTGNTERFAQQLQATVGGEVFQIKPKEAYSEDKKACGERAKMELANNKRPALAENLPDVSKYDTVFLGYPIWYGTAPMAVYTFLEENNFAGKVIVPFATSGSGGIEGSVENLRWICPKADFTKGLVVQEVGTVKMQQLVSTWLEGVRGEIDKFNVKRSVGV